MKPSRDQQEDSASEEDPDYVPPAYDRDSADDEQGAKRMKISPTQITEEEEEARKTAREELWSQFQASVPSASATRPIAPKMVKVEKRHMYAGEEVVEVKEVPENSEEAKKWPLWQPSPAEGAGQGSLTASPPAQATASPDCGTSSASQLGSTPARSLKKPGPRKPKTKLGPIPAPPKAKKLTTLDKSAMDWKSHVSGVQDPVLKDELEANRRGGGYLEKVEFLQRVGERKDEAFEANKTAKRRRG